jgi:hypothetical protein
MLEAGYGALEPIGSGNMVYSNQRHQFYRAWMKWPANFSLPRGCLGKLIYMRNTCPKQPCGAVLVRFESAGNGLAVDVENTYPSSTSPTKSQIKFDGRWHSIEAELDPAHSHINMWIDGNRVVNWNTPIRGNTPDWVINDTKYGMYINPVENHGCHPPKSESFWVDDMAQSTRRIGP